MSKHNFKSVMDLIFFVVVYKPSRFLNQSGRDQGLWNYHLIPCNDI